MEDNDRKLDPMTAALYEQLKRVMEADAVDLEDEKKRADAVVSIVRTNIDNRKQTMSEFRERVISKMTYAQMQEYKETRKLLKNG